MKKVRISQGMNLLPSLFTTGGMFCAFLSIIRSIHGDFINATWAIFLAGVFDLLDGRIARLTGSESDFGKEYDSLVDLASFGLAPAILMYTWALSGFQTLGQLVSFFYFACCALRLARFNVLNHRNHEEQETPPNFVGLPSPGAAGLLGSYMLFYHHVNGGVGKIEGSYLTLLFVPLVAILMVSNIEYRSFKEFKVQKKNVLHVLIGAVLLFGVFAMNPGVNFFIFGLVYTSSGPLAAVYPWIKRLFQGKKGKEPSGKLELLLFAEDEEGKDENNTMHESCKDRIKP